MLPSISIGSLAVSTYWTAMGLGAVSMGVIMLRQRKIYGLSSAKAILLAAVLLICGLSGTKLLYILENWQYTLENGVTPGGLSFFGAVFLVPLLMPLAGKLFGLRAGQTLDACAPCVASILAFTRFGCFLNGCCGGIPAQIGSVFFHWPTQMIESAGDFGIMLFLLARQADTRWHGRLYPAFLVTYGILRFALEFLRDTEKNWMGLGHGQWFAAVGIGIGFAWLRFSERKGEQ